MGYLRWALDMFYPSTSEFFLHWQLGQIAAFSGHSVVKLTCNTSEHALSTIKCFKTGKNYFA